MVGIAFSRSRPCNWRPVNEEASYTIYHDGDDGNFVDIGDDYECGNTKIVCAMIMILVKWWSWLMIMMKETIIMVFADYCHIIYIDSLCDDYMLIMIIWLWRVEGMIVTVGKGRRVFAEDSKQRERKMCGIILINYDHHHDDHNYHIFYVDLWAMIW